MARNFFSAFLDTNKNSRLNPLQAVRAGIRHHSLISLIFPGLYSTFPRGSHDKSLLKSQQASSINLFT
jgi:hypothetical protein